VTPGPEPLAPSTYNPAVDGRIRRALSEGRTIDITTIGRTSGQPRGIEMWCHNLDGTVYFTGTPGKRDWYANMLAHPDFTFHLKQGVVADLPARATPVTDPACRREILTASPAASGAPPTSRPGSRTARSSSSRSSTASDQAA
jgi:F420H(2)-dependent quinone reductase